MTAWLDTLLFGIYPYICLAVFFIGSWARFDRDQYTWKSDSSQLLRTGSLRWGSNLFHIGVLFLFFGHTFGMLTPHVVYEHFISAGNKQLMAMVSGGIAGVLAFVGVTSCCTAAFQTHAFAPPPRPATSFCCSCCGCNWRWAWPPFRCLRSTWMVP